MNEEIIKELVNNTNISEKQIKSTLKLLEEGCTIPFIARYRKEVTDNLDENAIKLIYDEYNRNLKLYERKIAVIKLIDEKGLLTEELKNEIMSKTKLVEVEDLYMPYKEKKKTKATEAIKMGLEPLAKKIMAFPLNGSVNELVKPFNMDKDKAIENASYIISEWISDNAYYRRSIRNYIFNNAFIVTKKKKEKVDEDKTYEMYYDFKDKVKYIKHYRVLAINRSEKEKIISVSLDFDKDKVIEFLESKVIKNDKSFVVDIVKDAIKDSLKRLLLPSIERDIRNELTLSAETKAIEIFSKNLNNLLLTPPLKGRVIMGFDPAFRTGCKLAVINEQGTLLDISVIYPNEPKNDVVNSKKEVLRLIDKYNIKLIAIGNGTASRESEAFVASAIKGTDVQYVIVSEAGASVYSASKLAIEEFPNFTVEKRSAVSIGRRALDPLSELVKIDAKSIGVGEYQHDVNQKELTEALDYTVSKCVNEVGVNVNTASESILKYISGMNKKAVNALTNYKAKHTIKNREEIGKIEGITSKIYEQAIGFLRVIGDNPLDATSLHPEDYKDALKLLDYLHLDIKDKDIKEKLKDVNISKLSKETGVNIYLCEDIIKELMHPALDPRDNLDAPLLKSNILTIEDLTVGMKIEGTVRNVASFGAFIDIGLHDDALLHISKMSKEFVKNPLDIVNVGDIIEAKVDKIELDKKKVSLSLI